MSSNSSRHHRYWLATSTTALIVAGTAICGSQPVLAATSAQTLVGQDITDGLALNYPQGIAVDGNGNVYVSNQLTTGVGEVDERTSGGLSWSNITSTAGYDPTTDSAPGLAVDSRGNVFIIATANGGGMHGKTVLLERSAGSQVWQQLTNYLYQPYFLSVDQHDNLYVLEYGNQNQPLILKRSPSGTWTSMNDGTAFLNPIGIEADAAGNLYVVDLDSTRDETFIYKFHKESNSWNDVGEVPYNSSFSPKSMAVDSAGDVFVSGSSSSNAGAIYELNTNGNVTTFSTGSYIAEPIAADNNGHLYAVGPSGVMKFTVPPSSAPANLTAENISETGWTETWSPVFGATGYNVYINGTKVTSSPVTTTNFNITGEHPNTAYNVTVTAVNAAGEGAVSAADKVTTNAIPPAPTGALTKIIVIRQFYAPGGTMRLSVQHSQVILDVPSDAFPYPTEVNITTPTSNEPHVQLPSNTQILVALGVNYSTGVTPTKPLTLTITNRSIKTGDTIYKISNGKLVAVQDATVSDGQATIRFTADPDFVITAPMSTNGSGSSGNSGSGSSGNSGSGSSGNNGSGSSGSNGSGTSGSSGSSVVPGATSPVTGIPVERTGVEGSVLVLLGASILWFARKKNKKA